MTTRRRLDRLARRMGDAAGATNTAQADYEAYQQAQLDAMSDADLEANLAVLGKVLSILDDNGAFDGVLEAQGVTRQDLGIDN